MPLDLITVRPASTRRVAFARWAVSQRPKIRTVSADTFGVPTHLFSAVPEELLVGALVDGQLYVPVAPADASPQPVPEQAEPEPAPIPSEPQEPAPPPAEVVPPIEPDPPVAGTAPAPLPVEQNERDQRREQMVEVPPQDEPYTCRECGREFASARGLRLHTAKTHGR